MSTAELKELVGKLAISQAELRASQSQTDLQLKELGRQIGGLGNKFGVFAEGLAFGSIRKILRTRFKMETITPGFEVQRGAESQEYDILAYSNGGKNKGMIVEVKSLLDQRTIRQVEKKMESLFEWMPEHHDKEFQCIVAYVHAHHGVAEQVLEKGWHLIHVGEDIFEIETPDDFQPAVYRAC